MSNVTLELYKLKRIVYVFVELSCNTGYRFASGRTVDEHKSCSPYLIMALWCVCHWITYTNCSQIAMTIIIWCELFSKAAFKKIYIG